MVIRLTRGISISQKPPTAWTIDYWPWQWGNTALLEWVFATSLLNLTCLKTTVPILSPMPFWNPWLLNYCIRITFFTKLLRRWAYSLRFGKRSFIIPIFKSDGRSLWSNYWAIVAIPKLFEKLICCICSVNLLTRPSMVFKSAA